VDETQPLPDGPRDPDAVGAADPRAGTGERPRRVVGNGGNPPGVNHGGGRKPFGYRLQRARDEQAERERQKAERKAAKEDRRAQRPPRHADQPDRAPDAAGGEALTRGAPDADIDATPFGIDRRRLKTKVRRLGFHNLQSIKGLRPVHDAAMMVGKKKFLDLIYLAVINQEPAAVAWWKIYEGLPSYEQQFTIVNLDEVSLMAGIRPDDLMKAVVGSAVTFGARTNELVFAVTHPRVIKNMAISAARVSTKLSTDVLNIAHKDRVAFLQGTGTLKQRGGPSININTKAEAQSASAARAVAASTDDSVPSFLADVQALDRPKATVQRQLQGVVDGESAE
jgi:hypothetical protein